LDKVIAEPTYPQTTKLATHLPSIPWITINVIFFYCFMRSLFDVWLNQNHFSRAFALLWIASHDPNLEGLEIMEILSLVLPLNKQRIFNVR
jgi:hypothetical protein